MNKLYRDLIVKHYRNPLNKGLVKDIESINYRVMQKKNISCGDEIILQVKFENQNITDIKYEVRGCAILIASASLLSLYLNKNNLTLAFHKIQNFCNMLQNKVFNPSYLDKELQSLKVIQNFPGKFICASMPWQLLLQMIKKQVKDKQILI